MNRAASIKRLQRKSDIRAEHHVIPRREAGSVLILALVFMVLGGALIIPLTSWTTTDLVNTVKFQNVTERTYAADGATQVAMWSERYQYPLNTNSTGYACRGTTTPIPFGGYSSSVADWCVATKTNNGPTITRQITFTACATNVTLTNPCAVPLLTAVVSYDDNRVVGGTVVSACTSLTDQSNCGNEMAIVSWKAS